MNKKILAILLALLMVVVSGVAMAEVTDGGDGVVNTTEKTSDSITINKEFTGTNKADATFQFVVSNGTSSAANVTAPSINGGSITIKAGDTQGNLLITIPSTYTVPGEYVYYITETAGNTAGVTYDTTQYKLTVTCYLDENLVPKRVASIRKLENGQYATKVTSADFVNTYAADTDGFTLKKSVAGNAADVRDGFKFTVEFDKTYTVGEGADQKTMTITSAPIAETSSTNAYTVTANHTETQYVYEITGLGHNEQVKFTNVPTGAKWYVTETDVQGDVTKKSYTSSLTGKTSGVVGTDKELSVTNTLNAQIDTGVTTDTMPYILLMAIVAAAAVTFLMKKRTVNE